MGNRTIVDCVFDSNRVETDLNTFDTGYGGALHADGMFSFQIPIEELYVIIDRTIIKNNSVISAANSYGGGLSLWKPSRLQIA